MLQSHSGTITQYWYIGKQEQLQQYSVFFYMHHAVLQSCIEPNNENYHFQGATRYLLYGVPTPEETSAHLIIHFYKLLKRYCICVKSSHNQHASYDPVQQGLPPHPFISRSASPLPALHYLGAIGRASILCIPSPGINILHLRANLSYRS